MGSKGSDTQGPCLKEEEIAQLENSAGGLGRAGQLSSNSAFWKENFAAVG